MSFTFVTGLYNISREQYDNRSYQNYQEWFKRTITVPVPMVIYTEICNKKIINESRKNLPTEIIYTTYQETPLYHTIKNVEHIIKNTEFKNKILHPNSLENNCYDYIPMINNKLLWMSEAIENNYFQTDMFFWIDAGLSRFFNFDMSDGEFNKSLIQQLHKENKIFIQIGKEYELNMVLQNQIQLEDIIGKNINLIMAGFWGGNASLLLEICKKGSEMYISEFINKEQVDNEQLIIGYILKNYLSNILFVKSNGINVFNYCLFCNKI